MVVRSPGIRRTLGVARFPRYDVNLLSQARVSRSCPADKKQIMELCRQDLPCIERETTQRQGASARPGRPTRVARVGVKRNMNGLFLDCLPYLHSSVGRRSAPRTAQYRRSGIRICFRKESLQAMIRADQPEAERFSISIPNTRLIRCAWISDFRRFPKVRLFRGFSALNHLSQVAASGRLHAFGAPRKRPHEAQHGTCVRPQRPGQISICSEISSASSTSIFRYLTVLSSLVWPSKS
jgi:hypothetical protein